MDNPTKLLLDRKDVEIIVGILDGSLNIMTAPFLNDIAEDIHLQMYINDRGFGGMTFDKVPDY